MISLDRRAPLGWVWAACLALVAVVLLNAWVSDDAYITFRTCYNLTHGYGPVFNVGERVQTFTNPLWMLLVSAVYLFTGEAYFTSIVLSLLLVGGMLWLLHGRIWRGSWAGVGVTLVLGWSLAFVEYATSGLENVLNGFLLVGFISIWLNQEEGHRRLRNLALMAALGMVSRMDTSLFYLPGLALAFWRVRSWRALGMVMVGMLPFLIWEAFALIYYGFPFPNTAYAKLNAGLAEADVWRQGLLYWQNLVQRDVLSVGLIAFGLLASLLPGMRRVRPIALGSLLYCIYIVRIGGDFMAGRFFFLPVLAGAIFLGLSFAEGKRVTLELALVALLGILNFGGPWYNVWRGQQPLHGLIDENGIADERAWYHDVSALKAYDPNMWVLKQEAILDSAVANSGEPVVMFLDYLGFMGYGLGPQYHIVDRYALADPLLARLPVNDLPDLRPGHLERVFPLGYRKTLRTGENHIEDGQLAEYYTRLKRVVSGPIWSGQRWIEIYHLNLHKYDRLIDKAFYHHPSELAISFKDCDDVRPEGEPFMSPGQWQIFRERPLTVKLPAASFVDSIEISLMSMAEYKISFLFHGEVRGEQTVPQRWDKDGLVYYHIPLPREDAEGIFDAIRIEGVGGSDRYAFGHLRIIHK
ncbi:MAG: hypothetical protein U0176_12820 [Bacteroidia bacterium]